MLLSGFCVKVSNDFPVDDRDIDIQEGNGCERAIAHELHGVVDANEISSEGVKIL